MPKAALGDRLLESLLKLFFYLLYNPFAWAYDWVASIVSGGRWVDWTFATLPYLYGERILELGHGPGHLQTAINQRGLQVYGIDLSPSMGTIAHNRLLLAGQPQRLLRGKAQSLPFPADVFDQIVTTFPSEYLYHPDTLGEIHRVLSPGGLLIVLPVVWIGRGTRIDRGLETVYRITHQAPAKNDNAWRTRMTNIFLQVGFDVRTDTIAIDSSEIFILIASVPKLL